MTLVHGERFSVIPEAVLDAPISDRAYRLYGLLRRYVDRSGEAFPGQDLLADRLGCSTKSIQRAMDELVSHGFVVVRRRPNTSSVYLLPSTSGLDAGVASGSGSDNGVASGSDNGVASGSDTAVASQEQRTSSNENQENENQLIVSDLCDALADAIEARGGRRPRVTRSWLSTMDRLVRLDGREPDDVRRVIGWLRDSPDDVAAFWAPNIRSPEKLRARWDQMAEQYRMRRGRNGRTAEARERSVGAALDRLEQEVG